MVMTSLVVFRVVGCPACDHILFSTTACGQMQPRVQVNVCGFLEGSL